MKTMVGTVLCVVSLLDVASAEGPDLSVYSLAGFARTSRRRVLPDLTLGGQSDVSYSAELGVSRRLGEHASLDGHTSLILSGVVASVREPAPSSDWALGDLLVAFRAHGGARVKLSGFIETGRLTSQVGALKDVFMVEVGARAEWVVGPVAPFVELTDGGVGNLQSLFTTGGDENSGHIIERAGGSLGVRWRSHPVSGTAGAIWESDTLSGKSHHLRGGYVVARTAISSKWAVIVRGGFAYATSSFVHDATQVDLAVGVAWGADVEDALPLRPEAHGFLSLAPSL